MDDSEVLKKKKQIRRKKLREKAEGEGSWN